MYSINDFTAGTLIVKRLRLPLKTNDHDHESEDFRSESFQPVPAVSGEEDGRRGDLKPRCSSSPSANPLSKGYWLIYTPSSVSSSNAGDIIGESMGEAYGLEGCDVARIVVMESELGVRIGGNLLIGLNGMVGV
ncbi:hypothetical protein EYR38_006565 [Pleurotus pulmonarius]|nr:hypothetical protein EYR38_006565 [Pleurotus pulmonarius]